MGPKKPVEPDEDGGGQGIVDVLSDLEIYIKDYILEAKSDDPILNGYILLLRMEERSGVPIFSTGLLDRPAFWERKIRPWILEGFQEVRLINNLSGPPV